MATAPTEGGFVAVGRAITLRALPWLLFGAARRAGDLERDTGEPVGLEGLRHDVGSRGAGSLDRSSWHQRFRLAPLRMYFLRQAGEPNFSLRFVAARLRLAPFLRAPAARRGRRRFGPAVVPTASRSASRDAGVIWANPAKPPGGILIIAAVLSSTRGRAGVERIQGRRGGIRSGGTVRTSARQRAAPGQDGGRLLAVHAS